MNDSQGRDEETQPWTTPEVLKVMRPYMQLLMFAEMPLTLEPT